MKSIFLANLTHIAHIILILFIFIGHLLLPVKYLKYYIYLIIIIFIDWNDTDGQCILTRIEYYFKTGQWKQKSALDGGPEVFRPFMNKLFNLNLDRQEAYKLNNLLFILCLLVAFLRYDRMFRY